MGGGEHFGDTSGRVRERFNCLEILLFNSGQGSQGFFHEGLGGVQISLGISLLDGDFSLNDFTLIVFDLSGIGFNLHLRLLHSDDTGDGVGVDLFGLCIYLLDLHVFFDDGDLFSGILKLDQTCFISFLGFFELIPLLSQHSGVELDQLQEGLGGRVNVSLEFGIHGLGEVVYKGKGIGHELDNGLSDSGVFSEIGFLQELGGDRQQGILGPGLEPIDHGGVNQGWEFTGTSSEFGSGGEAQTHMEIHTDLGDEEVPAVVLGIRNTSTLDLPLTALIMTSFSSLV